MKHIKHFEKNTNEPQLGDYVLCKEIENTTSDAAEYTMSNIGQIIKVDKKSNYNYVVKYENVPTDIAWLFDYQGYKDCRPFSKNEIVYFSKDKKNVERAVTTNKYNL